MREPTFFLLLALTQARKHGYALIAEVHQLSEGQLTMQVGTLYGALERLEKDGWVQQAGSEVVDGRHRRYYEITDTGAGILAAEAARLAQRARKATVLLGRRAAVAG